MRGGGGHGMNDFLRVSTNKIRSLVLRTSSFHPVWAQYQRSKSFACYEEGGQNKAGGLAFPPEHEYLPSYCAFPFYRLVRFPLSPAGLASSRGRFFAVFSIFKASSWANRSSSACLIAALSSLFSPNRTTIALSRRVEIDNFPLNKASSS